jgi:hypothetical protein
MRCSWGRRAGELYACFQANRGRGCECCGWTFSDDHTLLQDLGSAGPCNGHGNVAGSWSTPLHFHACRVLQCPEEAATTNGPVVVVLVGVRGQYGGDRTAAYIDTVGIGDLVRVVRVLPSTIGLEGDDGAITLVGATLDDDGHMCRAIQVAGLKGIDEFERAAAGRTIGLASVENVPCPLFDGEAGGQPLDKDRSIDADDIVDQKVFAKHGQVGLLDDVGVVDGEQNVGIAADEALSRQGRTRREKSEKEGQEMAHSAN